MGDLTDFALLGKVLHAPNPELGDEIGLMLHSEIGPWHYDQAPRNAHTFASTGGDGVHFSFLDTGNGISDASPIVMTVPMADHPNRILGANLRQFLGLGLHSGFFILEQLQYDFAGTVDRLERRDWEQYLSDVARQVLASMTDRFDLVGWSRHSEQLLALETDFAGLMDNAG